MKRLFLSVLAMVAIASPVAAQSLLEKIQTGGTITVGTEGTYPPFTFHDASGRLTGYDVEVARAVGKKLGVTIEFRETQWDAMLAGLKAGRFDLVANQVALTSPERQATFDKSEPYSWSGPMMVVRKEERKIKGLEDIKGRRAAQSLSSNYGELAIEYGARLVPADGMAQAVLLIQQKRADLTLNASLALLDFMKKHPNAPLKTAWKAGAERKIGAGLVADKGNEQAIAKISQAIVELRQEGVLKALGEQFFGEDVSIR